METEDLVLRIIQARPGIPKTIVFKLCYLFDLACVELSGSQRSSSRYIRYNCGPYSDTIQQALTNLEKSNKIEIKDHVTLKGNSSFLHNPVVTTKPEFPRGDEEILSYVMDRFGRLNTEQIEEFVYRTAPMKATKAKPWQRKPLDLEAGRAGYSESERREIARMALKSWADFKAGRVMSSEDLLAKLGHSR